MFFYSFELPSEETYPTPTSSEKRILLKRLDKDFFCKSSGNIYRVCIGSKTILDLNKEYLPCFLSATGRFRKSALNSKAVQSLFDKNEWALIFDRYVEYIEALESAFESFPVCLNLTFGDYCLLVPADMENFDLESLRIKATLLFGEQENVWENAKLSHAKAKVLSRFASQHVYKYLPCYASCESLISELLSSEADTEERGMECIVCACNLLYWFLEELSLHVFHKNGSLRSQESDMIEDLEILTQFLINYFYGFLEQTKEDSLYRDHIWSFLFITKALLFTILGPRDKTDDLSEFKRYDFSGFVPMVSKNSDTMDSKFCDLFAPQHTFAFLQLPNSFNFDFWLQLPAFIHEFFHYVPTNNRKTRNNVIIKFALQTVTNEFVNKLFFNGGIDKTQINKLRCFLNDSYKSISYLNTVEEKNNKLNEDSMFFLSKNRELFSVFDFESAYEALADAIDMSDKERKIHSELKNECIKGWELYSKSYLQTYTMAFREIRADMAMCILLDLSLMEYVEIMALEPTWSTYSADQTADSSIIRFGFITRYLFLKTQQEKGASFGGVEQFNSSYDDEMKKVCSSLKQANPNIKKNIDNILGYVEEYFDIMIESEKGYYTEQHHSQFESVIYPPLQMSAVEEACNTNEQLPIIQEWEQNFEEYKTYKLFDDVKRIYKQYHSYLKEEKYEEAVKLNYQSRLVLRDLFSYCESIHELGKTEA